MHSLKHHFSSQNLFSIFLLPLCLALQVYLMHHPDCFLNPIFLWSLMSLALQLSLVSPIYHVFQIHPLNLLALLNLVTLICLTSLFFPLNLVSLASSEYTVVLGAKLP